MTIFHLAYSLGTKIAIYPFFNFLFSYKKKFDQKETYIIGTHLQVEIGKPTTKYIGSFSYYLLGLSKSREAHF